MEQSLTTAIYAILIAFATTVILSPVLIPFLVKLKFGQNVRDDGPKTHLRKAGTPTMGGVIILLSFVAASLFFLRDNYTGLMLLFMTAGFGLIGFLDDYIKVVKKRSLGLRAYQKIIAQVFLSSLFIWYMMAHNPPYYGLNVSSVLVPFTNGAYIDFGVFYAPLAVLVMVATVNSVNLTDGLDGLATGVTVLVVVFFLFMSWAVGSGALPIAGAAVGSLMGFLLFNGHPANVFMGDTGSLALGGFVAAMAFLLRMPLFIPIVGIIFLIEALSVIIQVLYFKMTKQRFFKMAPIHHSFELSGWPETKVVTLFHIITAIACLVGFLGAPL